jgi:GntR family transcriptional regulator, carbon starvation induced regulator
MVEIQRKQTKSTLVVERLRQDIIAGRFASGEKLQMDTLKELYGVGYAPLREALSRLTANGLVLFEEQCGFSVAPVSIAQLQDLYKMRMHIETLALELALQQGDDQWESEVVACWHRYAKFLTVPEQGVLDSNTWDKMEREFSVTLIKACNSPWLLKIHTMLYEHAARYQQLCRDRNCGNQQVINAYKEECELLVAAVLSRDIAKAISLSQASWNSSLAIMIKELQQQEIA